MPKYDRVLVISPHADDEVLGCGGLLAGLAAEGSNVHVLYLSVDGMSHYGLTTPATYAARVAEINEVSGELGFEYTIAYGDKQLNERLDTLPLRTLVDLFQEHMDTLRPDLLRQGLRPGPRRHVRRRIRRGTADRARIRQMAGTARAEL
jgi:LmbE family N-acetylglucosaminyl deacetylase